MPDTRGEIKEALVTRGRLFGVTPPDSMSLRRYEARILLLLLGQPAKARSYLEYTLTFEAAAGGGRQTQRIGEIHYQLARAHRALGDLTRALDHAQRASGIFQSHHPAGRAARNASRFIRELSTV